MFHGCRSASVSAGLVVLLAMVTGCARDGSLQPRGSLKDTPEASVSAPRQRQALAPAAAPAQSRIAAATTTPERPPAPAPEPKKAAALESVAPPPVASPPAAAPPPAPARTSSAQPMATPAAPVQPRVVSPAPDRKPTGVQLLEEGRTLFKAGEVLAARERYVAALNAPLPEVLLELARTYDPNYLEKLPKSDAEADVERARALYEQASTLGSKLAEADIGRLPPKGR